MSRLEIAARPRPAGDETSPARERFLPFSEPLLGEEEIEAAANCLRSGWLTSGPCVLEFEKDFAEYIGCAYAVAVNSCTAALHLALASVRCPRSSTATRRP